MFKFFHRKALENSINDIEQFLQLYPSLDYSEALSDVMSDMQKVLPKGMSQTPSPATRAYCVDLVSLSNKAHSIGIMHVWLILTVVSLYFSAWDMSYHDPRDEKALNIKRRAKKIIDGFLTKSTSAPHSHDDFAYSTFDEWYKIFTECADSVRAGLAPMIAYMDQEPLRRAYADKIDPKILGTQFGNDFDVRKIRK